MARLLAVGPPPQLPPRPPYGSAGGLGGASNGGHSGTSSGPGAARTSPLPVPASPRGNGGVFGDRYSGGGDCRSSRLGDRYRHSGCGGDCDGGRGGVSYGSSVEALPRHMRVLAAALDPELRAFWAIPLTSESVAAAGADGGVGGGDGGPRDVCGVLYLMAPDELLFALPRDLLDQFARWLSDAIAEGGLRLLPDLADAAAHAPGPDAALAAASSSLAAFFARRTQGMAEVAVHAALVAEESGGEEVAAQGAAALFVSGAEGPAVEKAAAAQAEGHGRRLVLLLPPAAADAAAGWDGGSEDGAAALGGGDDEFEEDEGPCGPAAPRPRSLSLPLRGTLLHAALDAGCSTGMALGPWGGQQQAQQRQRADRDSAAGCKGRRRGAPASASGGGPPACLVLPDAAALPGRPQYVIAGVVREGGRPADSAAGGGGGPALGLYLAFSESLRPELSREMRSTLDVLAVLLSGTLPRLLGGAAMRPGLRALLAQEERPVGQSTPTHGSD